MNRVLPEQDAYGSWQYTLVRHPDSPVVPDISVGVVVSCNSDSLSLEYRVTGDVASLIVPPPATPTRKDGLWRHTCFEMFLGVDELDTVAPAQAGADGCPHNRFRPPPTRGRRVVAYREYNFAPSGEWAAYVFSGYRVGMRDFQVDSPPLIQMGRENDLMICAVQGDGVSGVIDDLTKFGLSAVLEDTSGQKSYWALSHPDGKADFHHADCFHPFPPFYPSPRT